MGRRFAAPVFHLDGGAIHSLAARVFFTLSDRQLAKPVWRDALEAIYAAATTGDDDDIEAARQQLRRAMLAENWLAGPRPIDT